MSAMDYEHFNSADFACKHCGKNLMDSTFLRKLDAALSFRASPIRITSGYRCPEHNKEVGSTAPEHPAGVAADIWCWSGPERLALVMALLGGGFKRLGIGRDFVHVDSFASVPSIWLYPFQAQTK